MPGFVEVAVLDVANIMDVDFWVIEESDMDMHPYTVLAEPLHHYYHVLVSAL